MNLFKLLEFFGAFVLPFFDYGGFFLIVFLEEAFHFLGSFFSINLFSLKVSSKPKVKVSLIFNPTQRVKY